MGDRFATGQVEDVFLTSDGTNTGIPARARVEQQELYASTQLISTRTALDFTVHAQVSDRGVSSNEFFLVLEFCPEALLDQLLAILDDALSDLTSVRVRLSHLEAFDVQALPLLQERKLYTFDTRSGGIARNVRIKFVSLSAGGA
jgi:hypothetical protein